jgi:hypothetical protein
VSDKEARMIRVGTEFVAEVGEGEWSTVVGQVTEIHGPNNVWWTPIYDPRHNKVFAPTTLAIVEEGVALLEALAREEAQQAAEIWAENAWLRAAEAGSPEDWREEQMEREREAFWGYDA